MIEPGNAAQWYGATVSTLALLVTILLAAVTWRRGDATALTERHGKLAERVTLTESDVRSIRDTMAHLPDSKATNRLEIALARMEGQLSTMETRLEGRLDTMEEKLRPVAAMAQRSQDALEKERR